MNNNTMEYLKKSYSETIHKGNMEFASESPKHDLFLLPLPMTVVDRYKKCELRSTSGTVYLTGTGQECLDRKNDLEFFVRSGYEKSVYNHYYS